MHILHEYKRLVRSSSRIITFYSHQKRIKNVAISKTVTGSRYCIIRDFMRSRHTIQYLEIFSTLGSIEIFYQYETLRIFTFCQFGGFKGICFIQSYAKVSR